MNGPSTKEFFRDFVVQHSKIGYNKGARAVLVTPSSVMAHWRGHVMTLSSTPLQRIVSKIRITPDSSCWVWGGTCNRNGYGEIKIGKTRYVHRVMYELLVGPISQGMQIDHLCRNRACCNPFHLEQVTQQENVMRGFSPSANGARQTHCNSGHLFDESNTFYNMKGHRICLKCRKLANQRRKKKVIPTRDVELV